MGRLLLHVHCIIDHIDYISVYVVCMICGCIYNYVFQIEGYHRAKIYCWKMFSSSPATFAQLKHSVESFTNAVEVVLQGFANKNRW